MKRFTGLLVSLAAVVVLAVIPLITHKDSSMQSMFTILLGIALASSLNILLGYTGYVSFGHIVYFGIGGYVGFYTMAQLGQSLWIALLAGAAAAAVFSFLLGSAILRLRGAYFALATIGVNEAMKALVSNFDPFGGPIGMTLKVSFYKDYGGFSNIGWMSYRLLIVVTLAVVITSYLVKKSKFGLGLMAIREDEDAAEVMGVRAPSAKTWAYVLSAVFPALVGVLFFFKNSNIEPGDAFRLQLSIEMIVMVMLGGLGTVIGPILGAGAYQALRSTLLTVDKVKDVQLAVAGVLLLLIILFIPTGAIGWVRRRFPRLRRVLE
jgi:branched-chain amino acid transport system permease protein